VSAVKKSELGQLLLLGTLFLFWVSVRWSDLQHPTTSEGSSVNLTRTIPPLQLYIAIGRNTHAVQSEADPVRIVRTSQVQREGLRR
jgi:hypothetical protein